MSIALDHPLSQAASQLESASTEDILRWTWDRFGVRAAIGTSFQGAGLVIMHLAHTLKLPFPVFTLDTGLLFPETLELKAKIEAMFSIQIESLRPDFTVEKQAEHFGPELWKRDPDQCCTLRKVIPLQSKLRELDCWITGLRRDQSDTRSTTRVLELYEFEANHEIVKINPMASWSRERVWNYIRDHQLPYNPLHDQGYRSIGCTVCTSKTGEGGNERAGRWTGFSKTECGIHTFLKPKLS